MVGELALFMFDCAYSALTALFSLVNYLRPRLAPPDCSQILFGVLGDLFGRKKMYGWLLVIILWATVGLVSVADASHGSMNITGWFFVWRFVMGFGIGGMCRATFMF